LIALEQKNTVKHELSLSNHIVVPKRRLIGIGQEGGVGHERVVDDGILKTFYQVQWLVGDRLLRVDRGHALEVEIVVGLEGLLVLEATAELVLQLVEGSVANLAL